VTPVRRTDLDDRAALAAGDRHGMLRDVASSAAQVREAAVLAQEAGVDRIADARPRAVVVCGMGGSGIAGDVLAAVAGSTSPVPVLTHRGYGLPPWVGANDLVAAVSCSGTTEETVSALAEAVRRGCPLVVVGAEASPVHDLAQRGRGVFVPVTQGRQPRASIWALSTPLVVAGARLGLFRLGDGDLDAAAGALEELAQRCGPDADQDVNPGKQLAGHLLDAVPVVWGTSPLAGVAAYRFACQINENAKGLATWGELPEANHNQVVGLDGAFAPSRGSAGSDDDLFRDRADDVEPVHAALVLLRDAVEHPQTARRAEVTRRLAEERGLRVAVERGQGEHPFERLVRLVGVADFASVYLALAQGVDPTPVEVISELKRAIAS
jgi:glucose/mannose-6-phosphate isomerase